MRVHLLYLHSDRQKPCKIILYQKKILSCAGNAPPWKSQIKSISSFKSLLKSHYYPQIFLESFLNLEDTSVWGCVCVYVFLCWCIYVLYMLYAEIYVCTHILFLLFDLNFQLALILFYILIPAHCKALSNCWFWHVLCKQTLLLLLVIINMVFL